MFLTLLDRPEFLEAKTLRWFSRYRPRAAPSFVRIGKLRGKSGLRLLCHAGCSGVGPRFWSGQVFFAADRPIGFGRGGDFQKFTKVNKMRGFRVASGGYNVA